MDEEHDYILDATVLLWLEEYGDVQPAVEAAAYGNSAMFAKMYRDGSWSGEPDILVVATAHNLVRAGLR